jgi:hypothetical protein
MKVVDVDGEEEDGYKQVLDRCGAARVRYDDDAPDADGSGCVRAEDILGHVSLVQEKILLKKFFQASPAKVVKGPKVRCVVCSPFSSRR